jgi:haloalkane dehalogenase
MYKRSWLFIYLVTLVSCTHKEYSGPVSPDFEPDNLQIEALRTPDSAFAGLSDFSYDPQYITVSGNLRMHYIDENSSAKKVAVLIHGEPTWSYTFRYMIPVLVEAGYRVVVPDLIGFGKSDKPVNVNDHTYQRHVNWTRTLLFDSLRLDNVNFFFQDMGGMIGLRLVAEHPERVQTVVVVNSAFPTGDQIPGEAFLRWQETLQNLNPFPVGTIVQWGCQSTLKEEVISAYNAPFPDSTYKVAPKIFPMLIPTSSNDPNSNSLREAWQVLRRFNKPVLTLYGESSHITRAWYHTFQEKIPGASNQPHELIPGGGHFLEEDSKDYLALKMISFIANSE